eukprot:s1359_g4.t1
MGTESGAAASAATSTTEKEGSLWNILPSFDPQQDDPREYRDKVTFLHGICPKKDRMMLAPRLAMLMKGTAWAQVKQIAPEKLTEPETGVKALLQAISTWEETEEMQLYDKFEKAIYRTTQRSDETTQSYVNRLAVSFHELGTLTVKDIKAFIVLRQSALGVEDKKRVLTMAGDPLTQEAVEKAMRQLSTKVLVGQNEGRKKVYPVNFVEDEPDEAFVTQEHEMMDEEQAIILMAEQGDDDAQLIKEFEDQLIEVCQENQDLAMCYTSYAEARTKIRERLRHRGFWPSGQKGRGKGGKKGHKGDWGKNSSKKQSLAERIASSHCRRCGARGHWKWECPAKDGNKEDVNVVFATDPTDLEPEILEALPTGARGPGTIEELFEMMAEKDCRGFSCSQPPGIVFNSVVNVEFEESALVCSEINPKVNGHCLGKAVMGALSRKAKRECVSGSHATGCPGIIDTGASKTVIGQSKIKSLIRSMPSEVQKQMNWKKSETVFRFGNNAILPSVGALYLPFGKRWMKIEVVEGDTPFLLSNSFLRAIDADVCTRNSTLRLNQLDHEVPLKTNSKGLFVVELSEVISAFSREHQINKIDESKCELVTNVTFEQQLQPEDRVTTAEVAQPPNLELLANDSQERISVITHGVQAGHDRVLSGLGSASAISGRSNTDIHDCVSGGRDQTSSGHRQPPTVGPDGLGRGQVQGPSVPGCDQQGSSLCQLDEKTPASLQRLGAVVPELCQSMGSHTGSKSDPTNGTKDQGSTCEAGAQCVERGRGRVGADRSRVLDSCGGSEDEEQRIVHGEEGNGIRRDSDAGRGEPGAGPAVAAADRNAARPTGQGDQEYAEVRNDGNNSNEQLVTHESNEGVANVSASMTAEVIQRGHEILCHLADMSNKIEADLHDLLTVTPGEKSLRHQALRSKSPACKLDLLEIYCEKESTLTTVMNQLGLKAKRFTREDGDLSTAEGREKLWRMIDQEQPLNIWVAPECKFWGNFSRWNSGRNPATAATIQAGRERERVHLKLCCELYWHQVSLNRHFHLEQPQGSEAMEQKELRDVVWGTYRTVFDMCEVGGLKIPKGNNYLRKRTVVLTTSKEFHSLLDARYCRKNHLHSPILGQMFISGRWQNLSAFAAKYSHGFAKNVAHALHQSKGLRELPWAVEELSVPCFGVRAAEQKDLASDIVKRRKYSHKQGPRPGEEESPPLPERLRYGPAASWRDVFKEAGRQAPRVGSMVVSTDSQLFAMISALVHQFQVKHVEICKGTERFRLPQQGLDLTDLTHRLTVILNRESGWVEIMGDPEEWQKLPRCKQIRKAKPARMSITVFGSRKGSSPRVPVQPLGKNLAEGDGKAEFPSDNPLESADIEMSPPATEQQEIKSLSPQDPQLAENRMERGFMPKIIPRHGPGYLALGKEEQEWVRSVHNKMGHPDPQRFARFLKSTHAKPEVIAGALDFQCDSCVESQRGFQLSRPAAIHDELSFNDVVGMDVKGQQGVTHAFVHFLDEGTLFHQALPCHEDATSQFRAFEATWLNWAGPPKKMYFDPATEYVSEGFLANLQGQGIQTKVTARDSHWQLGRTEVHGAIIKRMLDRMDMEKQIESPEQFRESLIQAVCAKNALSRIKGYTPEQAVLGISRRLPASITSDTSQGAHTLALDVSPESDRFRAALERRSLARKAFIEADNCSSLRCALLRRTRPMNEPYEEGDWVLYWKRKGGNMRRERGRWFGPARVVQIEGKRVVWLVHANQLVRASPEQLRPASSREWKAVQGSEEAMHPVKDWLQKIRAKDFFDLEAEELPPDETQGDGSGASQPECPPSSGYSPSVGEPEGEAGEDCVGDDVGDDNLEPGDLGGLKVHVDTDDDVENSLFGDTLEFWEPEPSKIWEIDITPPTMDVSWNSSQPEEVIMIATELRKKRVEVSLKELGEEDQLRFAAAKDKEIRAWLHHKTVQKVAKGRIPDHAVMRCRWLLTWKGATGDEPPGELAMNGKRAKARLVIIGYEDPDLSTIKNDSPTLSKDGRQTVLQQVSSRRWPLISFDVSTAFLHGRGDGRQLGIHPPDELRESLSMGEHDQCALNGGAYGRVDAPYLWFCELRDELLYQGCRQCPLDPCVFTYGKRDDQGKYIPLGCLGVHVDDGIGGGTPEFMDMLQRVEKRFKFGSFETGEFKYTGIHFKQWDDGSIEYDQKGYVEKIEPIVISKERRGNPESPVSEPERKALRSLIWALQYASVHTRPDISAKVGEVQAAVTKATVADLIQCNRILHEAKTHPVSLMVLPIAPEEVTLCAFSDASFMSSKHSTAHQGTLIFTTTKNMLDNQKAVVAPIAWSSKKVPRVVRSTLSAEAAALSSTVDRLLWLRMLWAWSQDPDCEWGSPEEVLDGENKAAVVTDCRSMYDILTKTAVPNCSEYRTTIECLLLRERLKSNCDVRWVTSQAMLADCLTKTMDSSALRECLRTGKYSLFDEDQVLKQRADGRQRLKWIRDHQKGDQPTTENQDKSPETLEHVNVTVQQSEPQDFWCLGETIFYRKSD